MPAREAMRKARACARKQGNCARGPRQQRNHVSRDANNTASQRITLRPHAAATCHTPLHADHRCREGNVPRRGGYAALWAARHRGRMVLTRPTRFGGIPSGGVPPKSSRSSSDSLSRLRHMPKSNGERLGRPHFFDRCMRKGGAMSSQKTPAQLVVHQVSADSVAASRRSSLRQDETHVRALLG